MIGMSCHVPNCKLVASTQLNSIDALLASVNPSSRLQTFQDDYLLLLFFLFVLFVLNKTSEEQFFDILWVFLTFYRHVG